MLVPAAPPAPPVLDSGSAIMSGCVASASATAVLLAIRRHSTLNLHKATTMLELA